jgi:hypothetical protein
LIKICEQTRAAFPREIIFGHALFVFWARKALPEKSLRFIPEFKLVEA